MSDDRLEIDELVVQLASHLDEAGIPYAIGGAIAYGVHAVPRATLDINIFVSPEDATEALDVLVEAGVQIEIDSALEQLESRGDARGYADAVRVDIFANSIPLHAHAARRRRQINFGGQPVWFLSIEDLLTLKMLFFRPKDIEDCKRAIALLADELDTSYVRKQLLAHVGEGVRLTRWDELVAAEN